MQNWQNVLVFVCQIQIFIHICYTRNEEFSNLSSVNIKTTEEVKSLDV